MVTTCVRLADALGKAQAGASQLAKGNPFGGLARTFAGAVGFDDA